MKELKVALTKDDIRLWVLKHISRAPMIKQDAPDLTVEVVLGEGSWGVVLCPIFCHGLDYLNQEEWPMLYDSLDCDSDVAREMKDENFANHNYGWHIITVWEWHGHVPDGDPVDIDRTTVFEAGTEAVIDRIYQDYVDALKWAVDNLTSEQGKYW